MYKKIPFLLSCLWAMSCISVNAQEYSHELGKINSTDRNFTVYEKDKDAEAVVMFDIGRTYYERVQDLGFLVRMKRTVRIKILKESGLERANIVLDYYDDGDYLEKIIDIKATTYNIDNGMLSKSDLDANTIIDETINKYYKSKKFAMPNVKVGSIIEYTYTLTSNSGTNIPDWEFQCDIPTMYSKYSVAMIPFYEFAFLFQGARSFSSSRNYKGSYDRNIGSGTFRDLINEYVMVDVPAFTNEEFITSKNDYIVKMDFQLSKINHLNGAVERILTDWDEISENKLKHVDFGKYIKKSNKSFAKLVDISEYTSLSEKERFNKVMDFVKTNYKWNGYIGQNAAQSVSDLIDTKEGLSSDINLFIVGAMQAVGLKADPVLISTRDHGKVFKEYAFLHYFNYTVAAVQVDGKTVLADGTDPLCLNNRIPIQCINDVGFLINEDQNKWISTKCRKASVTETNLNIEFSENTLKAHCAIKANEYDGLYYEHYWANNKDNVIDEMENSEFSIEKNSIEFSSLTDSTKKFVVNYDASSTVKNINGKMYINPFLNTSLTEDVLVEKERTYPVDMIYPQIRSYFVRMEIPEGYELEFIPKNQKVDNSLVEMNYTVENNDGALKISFSYFLKKGIYPPEDYKKLRYYYQQIIKKSNEKIVLKKV